MFFVATIKEPSAYYVPSTENVQARTIRSGVLTLRKVLMYIFLGSDQFHLSLSSFLQAMSTYRLDCLVHNYIAHLHNGARIIDCLQMVDTVRLP